MLKQNSLSLLGKQIVMVNADFETLPAICKDAERLHPASPFDSGNLFAHGGGVWSGGAHMAHRIAMCLEWL